MLLLGPLACVVFSSLLVPLANADRVFPPKIVGRGEWGPTRLGLSCRVTTDRADYEIGDPVHVFVEVRNLTDRPIALGLEPLLQVGRDGRLSRQSAEVHLSFTQEAAGKSGFFSTYHVSFPRGTGSEARAVVVPPKGTYSEVVTRRPWGPTFGSAPNVAQPGGMTLTAALWQFLSPELKRSQVECAPVAMQLRTKNK
jgi:hypothetical protein